MKLIPPHVCPLYEFQIIYEFFSKRPYIQLIPPHKSYGCRPISLVKILFCVHIDNYFWRLFEDLDDIRCHLWWYQVKSKKIHLMNIHSPENNYPWIITDYLSFIYKLIAHPVSQQIKSESFWIPLEETIVCAPIPFRCDNMVARSCWLCRCFTKSSFIIL